MDKKYDFMANEEKLAEDLIKFNDVAIKSIKTEWIYSTSNTYYKIVINYLFHNGKEPYDILKYMKRYNLLFLSVAFYKDKQTDNPFYNFFKDGNLDFNDVLNLNEDCIDKSTSSIFKELLTIVLKENNDYKSQFTKLDYNTYNKYLKAKNSKAFKEKLNSFHNSFLNNINYFNISNVITNYLGNTNKTSIDKLIADYEFNQRDYIKFNVYFEDEIETEFNECLRSKNDHDPRLKETLQLMSCIIDNMFRNNNLDFSKYLYTLPLSYYYVIADGNSQMKFNKIMFLQQIEDNVFKIDKDFIHDFHFTYNGVKYIFTKNGIIKA